MSVRYFDFAEDRKTSEQIVAVTAYLIATVAVLVFGKWGVIGCFIGSVFSLLSHQWLRRRHAKARAVAERLTRADSPRSNDGTTS